MFNARAYFMSGDEPYQDQVGLNGRLPISLKDRFIEICVVIHRKHKVRFLEIVEEPI